MGCTQTRSTKKNYADMILYSSQKSSGTNQELMSYLSQDNDSVDTVSVSSKIWGVTSSVRDLMPNYQEIVNRMSNHTSDSTGDNVSVNGLINHNNTCFINATLQCVFRMQPLVDYFTSQIQTQDMSKSLSTSDQNFIRQFSNLIATYHINNKKRIRILKFCQAIEKIFPGYEIGSQEDAQELLLFLFDKIHNCLNRAKQKEKRILKYNHTRRVSVAKDQTNQSDIQTQAIQAWHRYLTLNKSIIIGELIRYIPRTGLTKSSLSVLWLLFNQLRTTHVLFLAVSWSRTILHGFSGVDVRGLLSERTVDWRKQNLL